MDDFSAQMISALQEYSNTTSEQVEKILSDVAKEAQKKLKSTSPKNKGTYKKGWSVTIERRNGKCVARIHNKRYQLTHLLEKGHRSRNGGWVQARPHIATVNDWAAQETEKRIKEALGR